MQITDGAAAASRLAELMVSDEPRPEYAEALRPFAPLIGSWDLDVAWYDETGAVTRQTKGEWHFAWALDGRAVADVWITPSRAARATDGDGEWGLSIRIHDPELNAFRSTWMGPKAAFVMPFISGVLGYDVFDPAEVVPEFAADIGIKRAEKIDYAIVHDGQVRILIEAKKIDVLAVERAE